MIRAAVLALARAATAVPASASPVRVAAADGSDDAGARRLGSAPVQASWSPRSDLAFDVRRLGGLQELAVPFRDGPEQGTAMVRLRLALRSAAHPAACAPPNPG